MTHNKYINQCLKLRFWHQIKTKTGVTKPIKLNWADNTRITAKLKNSVENIENEEDGLGEEVMVDKWESEFVVLIPNNSSDVILYSLQSKMMLSKSG